jgi:hypothetical protein
VAVVLPSRHPAEKVDDFSHHFKSKPMYVTRGSVINRAAIDDLKHYYEVMIRVDHVG